MVASPKVFHDPAAPERPPAMRRNGGIRLLLMAGGAIAVGLGSSYITVLTATPSRAEVRDMIGGAISVVKETAGLDRQSTLEWRTAQAEAFNGLRGDVQGLQEKQARTNALLEVLIAGQQRPG